MKISFGSLKSRTSIAKVVLLYSDTLLMSVAMMLSRFLFLIKSYAYTYTKDSPNSPHQTENILP